MDLFSDVDKYINSHREKRAFHNGGKKVNEEETVYIEATPGLICFQFAFPPSTRLLSYSCTLSALTVVLRCLFWEGSDHPTRFLTLLHIVQ